jgi:GAF domain-containing protein
MTDESTPDHLRVLPPAGDAPARHDEATAAVSEAGPGHDRVVDAGTASAELARIVLGAQPLGAVLTRVAQLAAELLPEVEEVSVTLIERGRARTVAFSGHRAAVLDERQYQDGYGPCLDAAVTGQTITVQDTATDTLYPQFSAASARAGIKHTLSIGLATVHGSTGALNLYGAGAPFNDAARDIAAGFASYAAVAVANAAVYAGALAEVEQMRTAMASRAAIEQAKGIIMASRRCTAEEAFAILREASSRANRKLHDIAEAVVKGATGT